MPHCLDPLPGSKRGRVLTPCSCQAGAVGFRRRVIMKTEAMVQTGVYVQETMKSPAYQAYQILRWGFVAAPILAGLDKFFMKLTDWTMYLAPQFGNMVAPHLCMQIVGAIEIVAG